MSQKRKRCSEEPQDEPESNVFRSESIKDRASTFIGYFSPSTKPAELQRLEEIASADHKILAWRRASNQQAITGGIKYVADHDDDGEKYAGKKVEKVLENLQVSGACVVARWYGGVLLGPARFTHIEDCAKGAIKQWQDTRAEQSTKKMKAGEDTKDQERLVKMLAERDQSIAVLRTLAAGKEDQIKHVKAAAQDADDAQESQKRGNTGATRSTVNYSSMAVDKLRALEKARDATLTFLLKRIDKAEAELAGMNGG